MECERLKSVFTFLTHKNDEVNFFERFKVAEAFSVFTLGVKKPYRRMGFGGKLAAAAVALSRELGFKVMKVETTSKFSQKIFQKEGFEVLLKMPYDSYYYNGRPINESTGEHTMATVYALKIERFKVDEAFSVFTLGVKKPYRRMGFGGKLAAAAVALSRELGFKVMKVEATSKFS